MSETFGRFAATPIGPLLSARDGGLTLSTLGAADLNRSARSDIAQADGSAGVEFAVWGDDPMAAVVGITTAAASLQLFPGGDAQGIGWNLGLGQVFVGGVPMAAGLPVVHKGDIAGLLITPGAPGTLRLYLNGSQIHSEPLRLSGPLHFAAALGAQAAGGLCLAVNAGQWGARSPAAEAGWVAEEAVAGAARLADLDWLTSPGDAPANARFEGLIADGLNIVSELSFWPWGGDTVSQTSAAECQVYDAGGQLDALALGGGSGLAVQVRTVSSDAMLADSSAVFRFVLDRVEINSDGGKTIYFRDAHDDLDRTLNRGVFLPNIAALAWTAQPVVIGAVASVPGLAANSDATAMFLSDAQVYPDTVMDRGDLMESGTYSMSPDGQQLLLKSPPVTPLVADVSSIGAGQQPATLRAAMADIFGRLGKAAWSADDCAAVDAATGYAGVGYYSGGTVTGRTAMLAILPSYAASCYQSPNGVLRFTRIVAPEGYTGTLAFDLEQDRLAEDLIAVPDDAPNLTRRMAYRPNAQALGTADLVTDLVDVPQARRDELTALFRGQVYAGGALHSHYRHADGADPFVSVFWRAQDAQAEIDRVVGLYAVQRFFYQLTVRGDQSLAPLPGQVGRIAYSRYGLAAGKQVLVRRVERNPSTGDVVLTVWG